MSQPLRIGFIGSGFIAHFHLQALTGVRNVEVTAVYSTTAVRRDKFAARVRELDLGPCVAYGSIADLIGSGTV
ncbi:hypothetical protein ABTM61_19490, partial [Acinetobacter baumannii]